MKVFFKRVIPIFLFLLINAIAQISFAQGPPPPPSGDGAKGTNSNKAPGGSSGSPIGNGTIILIVLATAYAGKKIYSSQAHKVDV
jgi:hypothetical protein